MSNTLLPLAAESLISLFQTIHPDCTVTQVPERLSGGSLNFVWRLVGSEKSWIAKQALPYIASAPELALDVSRLVMEAKALEAFGPGGVLTELSTDAIRAPRLLHFDSAHSLLWMEDIGTGPALEQWLLESPAASEIKETASTLALFLADLHTYTACHETLAKDFFNPEIQKARFRIQYHLANWLPEQAYDPITRTALIQASQALGEQFLEPGYCLVMGDLWPPSIRVTQQGVRLIDWEFVNWGFPAQDIGHLLAHLWLLFNTHSESKHQANIELFWTHFSERYWQSLDETRPDFWSDLEFQSMRIHAGAEILIRTTGPFQVGGAYAGLHYSHPSIQKALDVAQNLMLEPQI